MTVRTRILLAQLVPLGPMVVLGLVSVLALLQMTYVVQETRTLGVQRIQAIGEAIDLYREEVVLLRQYRDTGEATYAASGRARSKQVTDRIDMIRDEDDAQLDRTLVLISDYERLAGLEGPPGDPAETDRAARQALRAMQVRQSQLRSRLQNRLSSVAETGRLAVAGTFLVVGILVFAGFLAAWLLGRSLRQDLSKLERGTAALAAGDFEHRIDLKREDEFGRLAKAFNRMAARIGAMDRMKVDFFANISHDLKTPLTSLLEAVDLLEEEVAGPLNKDQARLTKVCKEAALRLRGLVRNVLDVSRLGAKNAELLPGDVDATIRAALSEVSLIATRKEVELSRTGITSVPLVLVNRGMIEQVLLNLLINARQAMPDGGRLIVQTGYEPKSNMVVLLVRDYGCGMEQEQLQ
ncbi:MAG: HAMP domain-containing sensor histidine kinase, partial [Myxococcota bacterium]|nr:HAMP domain-containing sensor histidine kinase [Myxococcota bacterium]